MPTVIHIKKSLLPLDWQRRVSAAPDEMIEVTLRAEHDVDETEDDLPMRPNEDIRPEYIEEMKRQRKEYQAGKFKRFETPEELKAHLNNVCDE